MNRREAIEALMAGEHVFNTAWPQLRGQQRWVSIEDPTAVDVKAIDWSTVLGAESDDYRLYEGPR